MCHSADRWVHCDVFLNVNESAGRAQAADSFKGYDLPLERKKGEKKNKKTTRIILSETISTHAQVIYEKSQCQMSDPLSGAEGLVVMFF